MLLCMLLASNDAIGGGAVGAGSAATILAYFLNDANKTAKEERSASRAIQASHDELVRQLLPLIGGVSSVMERTLTVLTSKHLAREPTPDEELSQDLRDMRTTLDELLRTMKPRGPIA